MPAHLLQASLPAPRRFPAAAVAPRALALVAPLSYRSPPAAAAVVVAAARRRHTAAARVALARRPHPAPPLPAPAVPAIASSPLPPSLYPMKKSAGLGLGAIPPLSKKALTSFTFPSVVVLLCGDALASATV